MTGMQLLQFMVCYPTVLGNVNWFALFNKNWTLWTGCCGLYEYSNRIEKPGTYTVEYDHCIVQFIMEQLNVIYFYICVGSVNDKWLPEFLPKFGGIKVMQMRLKKPKCMTVMSQALLSLFYHFFYRNNFVFILLNMGNIHCCVWADLYATSEVLLKSGQCLDYRILLVLLMQSVLLHAVFQLAIC
jgi:hypothetical protein